jgi:hypothetical protein
MSVTFRPQGRVPQLEPDDSSERYSYLRKVGRLSLADGALELYSHSCENATFKSTRSPQFFSVISDFWGRSDL